MTHFLLIHGSWHGAWCWFKVLPRLGAHGAVSAVNLPGRGRDPTPLPSVDLTPWSRPPRRSCLRTARPRSSCTAATASSHLPWRRGTETYRAHHLSRRLHVTGRGQRREMGADRPPVADPGEHGHQHDRTLGLAAARGLSRRASMPIAATTIWRSPIHCCAGSRSVRRANNSG